MRGRVGKIPGDKIEIPEPAKPVDPTSKGTASAAKGPKRHDSRVKNPGVGKGNNAGRTGPKRTKDQKQIQTIEMVLLLRKGWSKIQIAAHLGISTAQISADWKTALKELREVAFGDTLEEMVSVQEERLIAVAQEALASWEKSKADAWKRAIEEDSLERNCMVCEGTGTVTRKNGNGGGSGGNGGNGGGSSKSGGSKAGSATGNGGKNGPNGNGGTSVDCFYCGGKGKLPPKRTTTTTTEGQCGDARYLQTAIQAYDKIIKLRGLNPTKKVDVNLGGGLDWSVLVGNDPLDTPVVDRIGEEIAKARAEAERLDRVEMEELGGERSSGDEEGSEDE